MKFALLGIDDELLALARRLHDLAKHEITIYCEPGSHIAELRALAPQAQHCEQWETLLLQNQFDALIVGRACESVDIRADQLRKLTQAGVPLVVMHPAGEYIVGYELEMIRTDLRGVIVPYFAGISHPVFSELAKLIVSSDTPPNLGAIEQIVIVRRMAQRTSESVLAQLARDAVIVRQLLGNVRKVSASGALDGKTTPVNLAVQMTGEQGILARWSVEPAGQSVGATLSLIGERGSAVLQMPEANKWELSYGEQPTTLADDSSSEIERLVSAAAGEATTIPTWLDACRAAEIAGTIPRCLARGKTIDLYNEEHTEDGAFKGIMAVGGCLIILLGTLALIFVAIVEGLQLPLHNFLLWRIWPLYLLVPILIFLFLQVLGLLARKK
ncbi:MAG TPA: hypothetical protein VL096_20145 [Pirellulaceae bacterium]|nr:hypothetical protein [Pirellulaceae bacterium]